MPVNLPSRPITRSFVRWVAETKLRMSHEMAPMVTPVMVNRFGETKSLEIEIFPEISALDVPFDMPLFKEVYNPVLEPHISHVYDHREALAVESRCIQQIVEVYRARLLMKHSPIIARLEANLLLDISEMDHGSK